MVQAVNGHERKRDSNMSTQMPNDKLLAEIETRAIELARGGGELLSGYFGGNLNIQYKDDNQRDPVTDADRKTQEFLIEGIRRTFPDHDILGEEDDEESEDENAVAGDFLWVLDPLDGTKNFLHGLPVYACSIGVLYRGEPVVGAVYIPWPEVGGVVHHARRGGGAFANGLPIRVAELDSPQANQLITLPGSFDWLYRFDTPMQGRTGDPRVTGSIAFELIMVARGVTQYMYTSNPHLWDIVGGVAVAMEAGASLMVGNRGAGPMGMFPSLEWRESTALVENWKTNEARVRELRRWARPLVLGSPPVARFVSSNLGWKRNPRLWIRMWRRRRRRT